MPKEIITKLERETGYVARDEKLLPTTKDKKTFLEYVRGKDSFVGVMYDDRIEFLKANNYALTRENLVNPELGSRQIS